MAAPAPPERILTAQLSLAAPANHVLQHAVIDNVDGLESTELAPTLNTFGDTHKLRLKELRCDKNNGIVKTTKLLVTNANFNAFYGDPDSYNDDNKVTNFAYESRNGAIKCRSGGAYIGDGLRVGGIIGAPLLVNDQPNPDDENTRIRTYCPGMNEPYIIKIYTIIISLQTAVADVLEPLGNHYRYRDTIPEDIYALCRRTDGARPRLTIHIIPIDNFGQAFHSIPLLDTQDNQFIIRATQLGNYRVIMYAERNDAIATANRFGQYLNTNLYNPVGGSDPQP